MNKLTLKFIKNIILINYIINNSIIFSDSTPMTQHRNIIIDKYPQSNKENQKISVKHKEKNTTAFPNDKYKEELMIKINNLCIAMVDENSQKVDAILSDSDIDINELCVSFNSTPLITAIKMNNLAMVKKVVDTQGVILTDTGDDSQINNWLFDGDGFNTTPLMHSIDFGNYAITEFLILIAKEKNQDVGINLQDRIGRTALFYASYNNDMDSVRLLLDAGANPLILNNKGKKASDYTNKPEIRELLLNAAKDWFVKQDADKYF